MVDSPSPSKPTAQATIKVPVEQTFDPLGWLKEKAGWLKENAKLFSQKNLDALTESTPATEKALSEIAALNPEEKKKFEAFKREKVAPSIPGGETVLNTASTMNALAFRMYQETKDLETLGKGFSLGSLPTMFKIAMTNPMGVLGAVVDWVKSGFSGEAFGKSIKTAIAPSITKLIEERAGNIAKHAKDMGFTDDVAVLVRDNMLSNAQTELQKNGIEVAFNTSAPTKPPQPSSPEHHNGTLANMVKEMNVSGNIVGGVNTTTTTPPNATPPTPPVTHVTSTKK
jgi:hypothetical protein